MEDPIRSAAPLWAADTNPELRVHANPRDRRSGGFGSNDRILSFQMLKEGMDAIRWKIRSGVWPLDGPPTPPFYRCAMPSLPFLRSKSRRKRSCLCQTPHRPAVGHVHVGIACRKFIEHLDQPLVPGFRALGSQYPAQVIISLVGRPFAVRAHEPAIHKRPADGFRHAMERTFEAGGGCLCHDMLHETRIRKKKARRKGRMDLRNVGRFSGSPVESGLVRAQPPMQNKK
jgi:hypothetical protein